VDVFRPVQLNTHNEHAIRTSDIHENLADLSGQYNHPPGK